MKHYRIFLKPAATILLVLALTGCAAQVLDSTALSQEQSKPSAVVEEPNEPVISTKNGGFVTAYYYDEIISSKNTSYCYYPLQRAIPDGLTVQRLNEIMNDGNDRNPFMVESMNIEDETILVELKAVPKWNSAQMREKYLNTAAATLLQNCDISKVNFTDNGELLEEQVLQDGEPDEYIPPAIKLPSITQQQIAAQRQGIDYDEVVRANEAARAREEVEGGRYEPHPLDAWYIRGDQTAKEIITAIDNATMLYIPFTEFNNIADAPNEFVMIAAITNTPYVYLSGGETFGAYYPQLDAIGPIISDMQCNLQEHVEITARKMFGDDIHITHSGAGISPWDYHEYAGAYTPPHIGIPGHASALLDYKTEGDTVTATVVYAINNNEFMTTQIAQEEKPEDYLKNREQRHQFTLKKVDGRYIITGHKMVDDAASMAQRNPELFAYRAISAGLTLFDWNSMETLTPDQLFALYCANDNTYGINGGTDGGEETAVSAKTVEESIAEQYGVAAETMRKSKYYNATYQIPDTNEMGAYVGWPENVDTSRRYSFGDVTVSGNSVSIPVKVYSDKAKKQQISDGVLSMEVAGQDQYSYFYTYIGYKENKA